MDAQQDAYAQQIIGAVKAAGLPAKAAVIAVETAITESGLQLYANSNVPESLQYPHSAVGHDHNSLGIFQQQIPWWGSVQQLMNAGYDTTAFVNALKKVNWQSMDDWTAAQAVQHSGYPDGSNYKANDVQAQQIVSKYWGSATGLISTPVVTPSTTTAPAPNPTGKTNNADWTATDVVQTGGTKPALSIGGVNIPDPLPWVTDHIPGYKNTTDALTGISQSLSYVAQLFKDLLWIFQPGNFIKAWLYVNGMGFILVGIWLLFSGSKDTDE